MADRLVDDGWDANFNFFYFPWEGNGGDTVDDEPHADDVASSCSTSASRSAPTRRGRK